MKITPYILSLLIAFLPLNTYNSHSEKHTDPAPVKDTPAVALVGTTITAVAAVVAAGVTAVGVIGAAAIAVSGDSDSGDNSTTTSTDSEGTTTTTTTETTTTTDADGNTTTTSTETTTTSQNVMAGPDGQGDMKGGGDMNGPWWGSGESFGGTIGPLQTQVHYESIYANADVKQADKAINQVMITRDRQVSFFFNNAKGNAQASVPIQIEIDSIMLTTKDIVNTFGTSSLKIVVAVNEKMVYEFSAMVPQGQLPEVTKNAQFGDISLKKDELSISNFNQEVIVDLPKDKEESEVTVSIITEGIGRRI